MDAEYWIWLQQALGYGSAKVLPVLEKFGGPKEFFDSSEDDKLRSGIFTKNECGKIHKIDKKLLYAIAENCDKLGYQIIFPGHTLYPERVLCISNPPAVLYIGGSLMELDDEVAIAIVGPRLPSSYGRKAAFSLAARLARAGVVVVSGGAVGIDADAHSGALAAGGKTIAVLGCGIDYPYLAANRELRQSISQNGCVISEYPPGYPPSKITFPVRNRIMSALTLGTAVIEAGEKSGALITAGCAVEQGRDIFVIPGNPNAPEYAGSNRLLSDGAKPLLTAMDILNEYVDRYPHKLNLRSAFDLQQNETALLLRQMPKAPANIVRAKPKPAAPKAREKADRTGKTEQVSDSPETAFQKSKELSDFLSDAARQVYDRFDRPVLQADELVDHCSLESGLLLAALTELELSGYIKALPGGRYRLVK